MSGTGIHRLIYRDICVERGASYAACAAHNTLYCCWYDRYAIWVHFLMRGSPLLYCWRCSFGGLVVRVCVPVSEVFSLSVCRVCVWPVDCLLWQVRDWYELRRLTPVSHALDAFALTPTHVLYCWATGQPLKVLCTPKWNDFEFPLIKTTKLLVEPRSCTWAKRI